MHNLWISCVLLLYYISNNFPLYALDKIQYIPYTVYIRKEKTSWDNKCEYCMLGNRNSECVNEFACL